MTSIKILGQLLGLATRAFNWLYVHPDFQILRNELIKWKYITCEPGAIFIGRRVRFGKDVKIKAEKGAHIRIGDSVFLRDDVDILVLKGGSLTIGSETVIGVRCLVRCRKLIEIGSQVSIGPDCKIIDHVHSLSLKGKTPNKYWTKSIKIGNGVGLFSNVFVGMGAEIGDFSKVSLNSVVKGPVPSSCFVGGDPLKIIFPKNKKLIR